MARTKNATRLNLVEALDEKSYDHAVICTYTFDAPFFEGYCLERLASLAGNVSVLVDSGVYEHVITGDPSIRPKKGNIRYLLHPIAVPGVFHPKLFLFTGRDRGRLILGSANCTRAGVSSNAELVGCYDFERGENDRLLPLFHASYGFLLRLSHRFPGTQLQDNLQELLSAAPWIEPEDESIPEAQFRLLDNLDNALWDQLRAEIEAPVDSVHVVSRYFDDSPHILDRVLNDLRPSKVVIYTQNGITSLTPEWLDHHSVVDGNTEIRLCRYADDERRAQPLHAKGVVVQKGRDRWFAFGSANFTSPALLRSASERNVETIILLGPAVNRGLDPERLFDPLGSAVRLESKADLRTSSRVDEEPRPAGYDIHLSEALLDGELLRIEAAIPTQITELTATINTYEGYVMTLRSCVVEDTSLTFNVPPEALGGFSESAVVKLIGVNRDRSQAESNPVLVINILDIDSGASARRQRHIYDAQKSAAKFVSVLNSLLRGKNEQPLIDFLNLCDIPLAYDSASRLIRRAKPVWDGGVGMRALGERNLKFYAKLHDAAMWFCERHLRKLQRHAKQPSPGSVANFLHIFLAAGSVLRAQLERLTQGFEARSGPLDSGEWAACRAHADAYFDVFEKMTDCLLNAYVKPMQRLYDPSQIKEEFLPDLEPLGGLYDDMLAFRPRIDRIRTLSSPLKPPGYFHSVLSEKAWPRYERRARESIGSVMNAVA